MEKHIEEEKRLALERALKDDECHTGESPRLEEMRAHNKALEGSSKYISIIRDVRNEVYRTYALEQIERRENSITSSINRIKLQRERIAEAKSLLDSNPEEAAEVFMMFGSCHDLWHLQKRILKEKYGIEWYTPAELEPKMKFD